MAESPASGRLDLTQLRQVSTLSLMQSSQPYDQPREIQLHERRNERQAETLKLERLKKRLLIMAKQAKLARAS
jgi:hypothetical protein